jgi:hypothetical protein
MGQDQESSPKRSSVQWSPFSRMRDRWQQQAERLAALAITDQRKEPALAQPQSWRRCCEPRICETGARTSWITFGAPPALAGVRGTRTRKWAIAPKYWKLVRQYGEAAVAIIGLVGCCARAACGHAAAPPSSVMNSRRFN